MEHGDVSVPPTLQKGSETCFQLNNPYEVLWSRKLSSIEIKLRVDERKLQVMKSLLGGYENVIIVMP